MKTITFEKSNLLNALTSPCNASTLKGKLDVFNFVRFEVKDINGTLNTKCTGNNGKCEVISYTSAISGDEVSFLVEGKKFKALVSTYNDDVPISVSLKESTVIIKQGKSKHTLQTRPIEEYPVFNAQLKKESTKCSVNTELFLFALDRVGFATGGDAKPLLANVNIEATDGELLLTATSGIILSQYKIPAQIEGNIGRNISISKSIVSQFLAMKGKDENTTLEFDSNTTRLTIGLNIINATIANQEYPLKTIKSLVPDKFTNEITIATKDLKQAISRIGISSDRDTSSTVLKIQSNDDSLLISQSNSTITSEDSEIINAKISQKDNKLLVGYHYSTLFSILNQVKGDEICLKINDKNTTIIEDNAHIKQPMLIMPCNI